MMSQAYSNGNDKKMNGRFRLDDALHKSAFLLGQLRDEQVRLNCIARNSGSDEYADEQIAEQFAQAHTALTQQITGAFTGFIQVLFCGHDGRSVIRSFADIRYAGRVNEFVETDVRREIGGIIISQVCNQIARMCDREVAAGVPELLQGSYELILKDNSWANIRETALLELEAAPALRKKTILLVALSESAEKEDAS